MGALTLTHTPTTPTKVSPTGIYVYHNMEDRISMAIQLRKDSTVTVAFAVCAPRDQFSRPRAQFILRARLEARKVNREGLTVDVGTYKGSDFKNDVFTPLQKYLRDNAYLFLVRDPSQRGDQIQLLQDLVDGIRAIKGHPESRIS